MNLPENSSESPKTTSASERQSADWDIKNAPKNYASLVLTQGGSAFLSFASVWVVTRIIGSEGYGAIVAVIAASQVAQIFVNWTSVAVVRFGVDEFIETEKIARTFWLRLFILLPNLLLVLLSSNLWFPTIAGWLKLPPESFPLVFLHFTATVLWIHFQYSLQAVKMLRLQGGLLTVERGLIFISLLILLASGNLTAFSATICYSAVPLLMVFAGLFFLRKFIFSRFSIDKSFIKKVFAYSLPLFPFSLVGYFSGSYVDAIFISKFLSTSDLGIYSVVTQITGIMLQLPTLANSVLLPLFVSLQKESQNPKTFNYFRNILPSLTLLWGFGCAVLSFAGYFVIPVIFGAEFREATAPFWILLTGSVFSLPILIGYSALSNSTSTTYISMFAAVFSAVTNIAANFLLIPKYGMFGCAWATLLATLVTVLTFALLLRSFVKMPVSWIFVAMLPNLFGALIFTLNQNPLLSLTVCAAMSFLVGYMHKQSLKNILAFINNRVRTKSEFN
ncbi:MAG TPA: oligosaccharide flippase family protein [Pyrinomonadaceae bacterium]